MGLPGLCDDCGERIGYECRCDVIRELTRERDVARGQVIQLGLELERMRRRAKRIADEAALNALASVYGLTPNPDPRTKKGAIKKQRRKPKTYTCPTCGPGWLDKFFHDCRNVCGACGEHFKPNEKLWQPGLVSGDPSVYHKKCVSKRGA